MTGEPKPLDLDGAGMMPLHVFMSRSVLLHKLQKTLYRHAEIGKTWSAAR